MVVPPHRDGGQAQFVQAAVPECTDDGLAPLLAWVVEHLEISHKDQIRIRRRRTLGMLALLAVAGFGAAAYLGSLEP